MSFEQSASFERSSKKGLHFASHFLDKSFDKFSDDYFEIV